MELRKTEEGLSNLIQDYQRLCSSSQPLLQTISIKISGDGNGNDHGNDHGNHSNSNELIADLITWEDLLVMKEETKKKNTKNTSNDNDNDEDDDKGGKDSHSHSNSRDIITISSTNVKEALQTLIDIRNNLLSLHPTILKFQSRLSKVDPVTKAPRYGKKTIERVQRLLEDYDVLKLGIDHAFDSSSSSNGNRNGNNHDHDCDTKRPSSKKSLVEALQQSIQNEQIQIQIQKHRTENEITQSKLQYERQKRDEEIQIQIQRQQEEERLVQQMEREELARRAEEARRVRIANEQRLVEEERLADERFLQSVQVGVDGVKYQLQILKQSCSTNALELKIALKALHTIFTQISSRPEEIQYRRIRRDHPKFLEDIGRHNGGKEVLIAAGFTFRLVDGVKCLFSAEPDLETDMDGWAAWFDLIKATTVQLEDELAKL